MSELLQAIYRGDRARADELLAGDPELDVFEAAAVGRTDRLRELLDQDPALANGWADDGFQPLGLASFFGHVEAARLLVERGGGGQLGVAERHEGDAAPQARPRPAIPTRGTSSRSSCSSTTPNRTRASKTTTRL